jgi:hypothetical protein
MRDIFIVLWMMYFSAAPAVAQVNVNIGINLAAYPELVLVPGYPVYYAPRQDSNFFFFDGMYWVYQGDNWYASTWYNGPWQFVDPDRVPLDVLRVPVRYYRNPPAYFYGWRRASPPRWGEHWGNDWARNRRGWDARNRHASPAPAPLPVYQRHYSGDRYPGADRQHEIRQQNYRYPPRDAMVREHEQAAAAQRPPMPYGQEQGRAPERPRAAPSPHSPGMPEAPRSANSPRSPNTPNMPNSPNSPNSPNTPNSPHASDAPSPQYAPPGQYRGQSPQRATPAPEQQRGVEQQRAPEQQRPPSVREQPQARPAPAAHEQPAAGQERHNASPDSGRGQSQEQGREREQNGGPGQGRNK